MKMSMESVKRMPASQRCELGKIFRKSSCSGRHKLVSANIRNCRGILYVWLGESWALWADDIKVDLKKNCGSVDLI